MTRQNKKNDPTSALGRGKLLLGKATDGTLSQFARFKICGLSLFLVLGVSLAAIKVAPQHATRVVAIAAVLAMAGCVSDCFMREKDTKFRWALFILLSLVLLAGLVIAGRVAIPTTRLTTGLPWRTDPTDPVLNALWSTLGTIGVCLAIRHASSLWRKPWLTTTGRIIRFCPSSGFPVPLSA
jgi:hypothetical protein